MTEEDKFNEEVEKMIDDLSNIVETSLCLSGGLEYPEQGTMISICRAIQSKIKEKESNYPCNVCTSKIIGDMSILKNQIDKSLKILLETTS